MSGSVDDAADEMINPGFDELRTAPPGTQIVLVEGHGCITGVIADFNIQTDETVSVDINTDTKTYTYRLTADGEERLTSS